MRHIVHTSPLWIAIVFGMRGSPFAKWAALLRFVFWLLLMTLIWLFLLGWARVVTGTYSAAEIAMTLIVGGASLLRIARSVSIKRFVVRGFRLIATVMLVALLQIAAIRVSLLPAIAHR